MLLTWMASISEDRERNRTKLVEAVCHQMDDSRGGAVIDCDVVKQVLTSLACPATDSLETNGASLEMYRAHIEAPLILSTRRYYEYQSRSFLSLHSTAEYPELIESCLYQEEARVRQTMPGISEVVVLKACEHALVCDHGDQLTDIFRALIGVPDRGTELNRLTKLLERTPENIRPLLAAFEEQLMGTGRAVVEKIKNLDAAGGNLQAYLGSLVEAHEIYYANAQCLGERKDAFEACIWDAAGIFMSSVNALDHMSARIALALATFTNTVLQDGDVTSNLLKMEIVLDQVVCIK